MLTVRKIETDNDLPSRIDSGTTALTATDIFFSTSKQNASSWF